MRYVPTSLSSIRKRHDRKQYLSNNLALLLIEHGVGLEKLMSYTLGDTKAHTGVIDLTQREGHLGVRLLDFVESLFEKYRYISRLAQE
jgi:hypothetical protein